MTVYKCPVCEGRGTMERSFYDGTKSTKSNERVTCKSCGGSGVIRDTVYPPIRTRTPMCMDRRYQ